MCLWVLISKMISRFKVLYHNIIYTQYICNRRTDKTYRIEHTHTHNIRIGILYTTIIVISKGHGADLDTSASSFHKKDNSLVVSDVFSCLRY